MLGAPGIQGEVTGEQLQRVAGGPHPGKMGLFIAAGGDQLRTGRDAGDHDAQDVVAVRGVELVQVIEHQDERMGASPEGGRDHWGGPAEGRYSQPADVGHQSCPGREHPHKCRCQDGQQDAGIVVETIERDPSHDPVLGLSPLAQQRRLPVPGGRRDPSRPCRAGLRRLDQRGATDHPGTYLRHRQLDIEQHFVKPGRRSCPHGTRLGHTGQRRSRQRGDASPGPDDARGLTRPFTRIA